MNGTAHLAVLIRANEGQLGKGKRNKNSEEIIEGGSYGVIF